AHPSRNSVSYRINALSIQSLPYSMHRRRAILCTAISKRTMKRAHKTLRAKVRKIIKPAHPTQPEKAEISIDEADDLYREIRIENRLMDEKGKEARLKEGAEVELQIEAEKEATTGKRRSRQEPNPENLL